MKQVQFVEEDNHDETCHDYMKENELEMTFYNNEQTVQSNIPKLTPNHTKTAIKIEL